MNFEEYRLLIILAVTAAFMSGYAAGKYLSRADKARVIETVIFVNEEFAGTMGPEKDTCGTCRGEVQDDGTLRVDNTKQDT